MTENIHFSKIGIVDFGGQYAHLLASRIRKLGIYTEILSNTEDIDIFKQYSGLIFSGGPNSVYAENSPSIPLEIFDLSIPILGICYGHQLIMKLLNGNVQPSAKAEYGRAELKIIESNEFSSQINNEEIVWMSHGDEVVSLPPNFSVFASTENCQFAGVYSREKKIFGIQFHPEVTHTVEGQQFLLNFVNITGAKKQWNMNEFLTQKINEIQKEVPNDKNVFMLVSGGVDSTVAYALLTKALGNHRVKGLLVDTGFMRKKEVNILKKTLRKIKINLKIEDASEDFYRALKGITEPERKRKIIGSLFLDIKNRVMNKIIEDPENWILGQGTIYPDTIESGGTKHSQSIKTHHNRVDEILELMKEGKLIEPIKELYKDEVRELGKVLGFDDVVISRHPFPGPGLAVRMISSEKDSSFASQSSIENVVTHYNNAKAFVLPIKSVGVQGDARSYKHCAVLNDFTRKWDKYNMISTDITNNIKDINRVVVQPFTKKLPKKIVYNKINLNKKHSDILRSVDFKVNKLLKEFNISKEIWQMPVALLPIGHKKNKFSVVLRPVESQEAMTANFYPMKRKFLKVIIRSILKIPSISYVFYDITNKPPGTIEWE
jgi:GMP synthase (glutamine-hydrolysing)